MKYSGAILLLTLALIGASKIKNDSKSEPFVVKKSGNNMLYHTM